MAGISTGLMFVGKTRSLP